MITQSFSGQTGRLGGTTASFEGKEAIALGAVVVAVGIWKFFSSGAKN